jgi:ribosomal protein S18 acetylase RimI-like enzyme
MLSIVDFLPAHLDGIVAICRAENWPSYLEDDRRTLGALTAPGIRTVVAFEEGDVAGFATAGSDGAIQAYLILIGVAAAHRRKGIGRRLVEEVFKRTGATRIDLISTEGADAFYASFAHFALPGFRLYPQMTPRRSGLA